MSIIEVTSNFGNLLISFSSNSFFSDFILVTMSQTINTHRLEWFGPHDLFLIYAMLVQSLFAIGQHFLGVVFERCIRMRSFLPFRQRGLSVTKLGMIILRLFQFLLLLHLLPQSRQLLLHTLGLLFQHLRLLLPIFDDGLLLLDLARYSFLAHFYVL